MSINAPEYWNRAASPTDIRERFETVRRATGASHLAAAREDYRRMMARVIPTPTYDAVVAAEGFDPRASL